MLNQLIWRMGSEPRLLIGLLFVLTSCQVEQESVVATADNLSISASEFREKYQSWLLTTGVQDAPQRRSAFVKDMAATRLAVLQARREGIEEEPHYQARRETMYMHQNRCRMPAPLSGAQRNHRTAHPD